MIKENLKGERYLIGLESGTFFIVSRKEKEQLVKVLNEFFRIKEEWQRKLSDLIFRLYYDENYKN
jgi:hypothetical protein